MKIVITNDSKEVRAVHLGGSLLSVFFLSFLVGTALGSGLGLRWDITGGPLFVAAGEIDLADNWSLNLTCGGFPGIIMRAEADLRLYTGKRWPSYYSIA